MVTDFVVSMDACLQISAEINLGEVLKSELDNAKVAAALGAKNTVMLHQHVTWTQGVAKCAKEMLAWVQKDLFEFLDGRELQSDKIGGFFHRATTLSTPLDNVATNKGSRVGREIGNLSSLQVLYGDHAAPMRGRLCARLVQALRSDRPAICKMSADANLLEALEAAAHEKPSA